MSRSGLKILHCTHRERRARRTPTGSKGISSSRASSGPLTATRSISVTRSFRPMPARVRIIRWATGSRSIFPSTTRWCWRSDHLGDDSVGDICVKLLWSSRSPFVRKVVVVAHELGIADRIALERVNVTSKETNADVMSRNTLNKIPTLLLDDGSIMIDSPVIAEYLDETFGKGELFEIGRASC